MELDILRRERTKIVTEGSVQSENIDWFYSPVRISFNDSKISYIDKEWTYKIKKKPSIFDGKLFHVKRQEFLPPRLVFDTCLSSFKEWIGTKISEFNRLFGQKRIIKPLSVGSMVVTSDNKWIIGRRLKKDLRL